MISPIRSWLLNFTFLAALLGLVAFSGCSKLLPARKGTAHSSEIIIDTRRIASESLAGRFVPGVFPAFTKLPIIMVQSIPLGAKFTSATHEVVLKNGDELAQLETVIENNQVYLKFAAAKPESFTQCHVLVRVKYEYR
jgi:hypothetical protein